MPRGVPNLGRLAELDRLKEAAEVPTTKAVGTIAVETIDVKPATSFGAEIDMTELPPPWESDPSYAKDNTDARRFIDVPVDWELRWINPRLLEAAGWRDWMPVMASDRRVTVKVNSLIDAGGNIRRGGPGGDILAWMPKHWVASRLRLKAERVDRLTRQAVDKQDELASQVRGASRGRISVDSASHPTHTMGEGRTMTDT